MRLMIKKYWPLIAIAIITIAGFLFRMYRLDWQCLMVDEMTTSIYASKDVQWIISYMLSFDYNPPTYYLIAHYSEAIFGITRFAVRFPAVIFGTLSIPAVYLVGKEVKGGTLGLLVASLVSFMFPFFYYSQNARGYSLVMLGFMGVAYFFVKMYRGDYSRGTIIGISLCTALCFWSHYYSLFPVSVLFVALLLKNWKSVIKPIIAIGLLMLPLALMFDLNQFATRTSRVAFDVFWNSPAFTAKMVTNEMLCWSWIVIIPLALYSLYRYRNNILEVFAIVGVATPFFLIVISQFTATMPRYAILVSPLIIIIAMYPVSIWIDELKTPTRKLVVFALVLFVIFLFNYGSILEWTTFSVCPFMTATGAAAP